MATETVSIVIKAFDQTQKALRGIQAAFGKLSKVFFNFKTALIGAVGGAGLGLLINNSLKATDALAKTAGKIGTTTEALSALQYAGQLTGVEVNTMNMALQRFTRRTAEAAVGTGEAKGALRELRLDARELTKLPLDEQMLTLADAFEAAKTRGVNPLKIAFKLFDSEGAALVNTLALGRGGLSDLLGEARRLGVVMSAGAAKGVEDANDALFRMQSLFSGVVKQTVAALAPAISALADLMTEKVLGSFDETNQGVQTFAKSLAENVVDGIIATVKAFQSLTNGLITTANELIKTKDALTAFFTPDEEKSARQLQTAIDELDARLERMRQRNAGKGGPLAEYGKADIKILERELAGLKELQKQAEEQGGLKLIDPVSFQGLIDLLTKAKGAMDSVTSSAKGLKDTTESELPSAFQTFMANLNNTREMAGDLTPELEKLGDQAITGLGRSFTAAITGAQNFADAIKSMAKSVIDSLIQMLVQKYIVDAAFGALTTAFGGGTTTSTGGGGGGGSALPQFARGGVATGRRPAIVGERGPELFIPSTTGRVVPNNELGGGGVTVVQNINVTTGVQQTVRAEIANLLPQISNAAKSAVADARMRGGGFSKAMVGA